MTFWEATPQRKVSFAELPKILHLFGIISNTFQQNRLLLVPLLRRHPQPSTDQKFQARSLEERNPRHSAKE